MFLFYIVQGDQSNKNIIITLFLDNYLNQIIGFEVISQSPLKYFDALTLRDLFNLRYLPPIPKTINVFINCFSIHDFKSLENNIFYS